MKLLIEAGRLGIDNTFIDIDGIAIERTVPLTINFDMDNIIGVCVPYIEGNELYIDFNYDPKYDCMYPCIGFVIIDSETDAITGIREVSKCRLSEVSLTTSANSDKEIQCIEIQNKFNQ